MQVDKEMATARTAVARTQDHSPEGHRQECSTSRSNPLDQIGDLLCLLSFFPLSTTVRAGLVALLEHRLARAYGGNQ